MQRTGPPPLVVRTALEVSLPPQELVDRINAEHDACQAAYTTALEHAIACGNLLYEVRRLLPHGEWQTWLAENFTGSARTAQVYVQLSTAATQNPQLVREARGGSIQGALKAIARKATAGPTIRVASDRAADQPIVDGDVVDARHVLTLDQLAPSLLDALGDVITALEQGAEGGRAEITWHVRRLAVAQGHEQTRAAVIDLAAACVAWAGNLMESGPI